MTEFEITPQNCQDYYRENNGKFIVLHFGFKTSYSVGSFDTLKEARKAKKEYNKTSNVYKGTIYQVYFSDLTCEYGLGMIK